MKVYNKLVRDRIPEIIAKSGKAVKFKALTEQEHEEALKDKLLEEVNEFLAAETENEIIEELADIQEVLDTISGLQMFRHQNVRDKQTSKKHEKGGFYKRYFLESVED